ncbi:MAG: hypothetical protein IIA40_04845 [SAR324 cluster bacterium]|nr:hypothetical protein [SAR324 cluster bacterium]
MSKRLPSPSVIYRGWLRNIAALALALALAPAALAQQPPQAPQQAQQAQQPPQAQQPQQTKEADYGSIVDETFSIRLDEKLFQLEEAISLIAGSLSKVADRTPTLAINSFHFGKGVDADFRRKAEVIILDKLFKVNPNIRLVQCQECQKLETKIERGVLKLRKGIPSQESRRALAEKLAVDERCRRPTAGLARDGAAVRRRRLRLEWNQLSVTVVHENLEVVRPNRVRIEVHDNLIATERHGHVKGVTGKLGNGKPGHRVAQQPRNVRGRQVGQLRTRCRVPGDRDADHGAGRECHKDDSRIH